MARVILLPLFLVVLLSTATAFAAARGFTVDLIHRNSPLSPYYNPSETPYYRLRSAAIRSATRLAYLRSVLSPAAASPANIVAPVIPNSFEYLMALSVGTPAFQILGIPDTGSDLIWTQCKPCLQCYKQIPRMFDPARSSTYSDLSCKSSSCANLGSAGSCDAKRVCNYQYQYADGSFTTGVVASDTLTFASTSSKGKVVHIPNITIGCAHQSGGTFDEHGSGLVGLGGGPLSLISQLNDTIDGKFSYCLVPYNKVNSSSSLSFGDDAVIAGGGIVSTPIIPGTPDTFFFLSLEQITVGGVTIPVDPSSGDGGSGIQSGGNIIIDSGTTLTYLPSSTVNQLNSVLEKLIELPRTKDTQFNLCFDSSGATSDVKLPVITFGFAGANVRLGPLNTFVQPAEGVICLSIMAGDSMSIFGNLAQQNFHVGYDLVEKKVSFAARDCTKVM